MEDARVHRALRLEKEGMAAVVVCQGAAAAAAAVVAAASTEEKEKEKEEVNNETCMSEIFSEPFWVSCKCLECFEMF